MNLKYLFLAISIVSLVIGLAAMLFMPESSTASIVQGIFKGLAGVFFILYYIFMLLGNQPTDESTH